MNVKLIHQCPKCENFSSRECFQLYRGNPNGWCQSCKNDLARQQRRLQGRKERKLSVLTDSQKFCSNCSTILDFDKFSPSLRGSGGLSSYCKSCNAIRARKSPEYRRQKTQEYRDRHRERWRQLHRIVQARRRLGLNIVNDGSVTDIFLKSLYSETFCVYCSNEVEPENRTADHKIPLSRGGLHSKENLVMACRYCNSSKAALTDQEFIDRDN